MMAVVTFSSRSGEMVRGKLARLEGIEPPTPGLEGRCSIQLSYRRVRHLRYTSGSPLRASRVALVVL